MNLMKKWFNSLRIKPFFYVIICYKTKQNNGYTILYIRYLNLFGCFELAYSPKVATITALIVCIRFSASSNTIEFSLSKTSSVTSKPSILNFS